MPPPAAVAEATKVPGGWVYEIEEGVDPAGRVPPEAIRGCWAVAADGTLTGEFVANPNYRGK